MGFRLEANRNVQVTAVHGHVQFALTAIPPVPGARAKLAGL